MTMTMTMTMTMIFQKNAKIRMLPRRRGERAGRTLMFQSGKKSKQSDLDFALLLGLEVTTNRDKDKIADNILPSFAFYLWLLKKIKFNCHPRMNLGRTKSVCRSQYKNFFYIHFPKMLKVLILYVSTVRSVQFFGKLTLGVKNKLGKFNKEGLLGFRQLGRNIRFQLGRNS